MREFEEVLLHYNVDLFRHNTNSFRRFKLVNHGGRVFVAEYGVKFEAATLRRQGTSGFTAEVVHPNWIANIG